MPGIFGVLAKRPNVEPRELESLGRRMADAMRTAPWLGGEVWTTSGFSGGSVHLGVVNPERQPRVACDGEARLWFDGEAFDAESRDGLRLGPGEILARTCGEDGLGRVDGAFNLAALRAEEAELTLVTDRLGFRPLYFTETKEWFAYAAEVKSLLAVLPREPELDRTSLCQFLAADHMFGERTWWKGIELIPPATVWRIRAGRRDTRRYWSFGDIQRRARDERGAVEELGTLWTRSVARRLEPGLSPFLLSGGLDSRFLLAEMRAQGADVAAFTMGKPGCADIEIARRCASLLGVPHRSLDLTPDNWWQGRERAMWQTDGLVNAIHLHVAIAVPHMRIGNRYLMKNSTGDTLFGGSKLHDSTEEWARDPRALLSKLLTASPFVDEDEAIEATLPDCRAYLDGPSSDCFVISQRQRRMILAGPLALGAHCEVVNPGVDLRLLHLLLGGMSDEQRRDGRFYHQALLRLYPALFRDIPRNSTGRGLQERWRHRVARGARVGLAKRLRNVPLVWRVARRIDLNRGRYHDYPAFLRKSEVVRQVVRDELLIDQYLSGRARPYLERAAQSGEGSPRVILGLVTIESYLRQVRSTAGQNTRVYGAACHV